MITALEASPIGRIASSLGHGVNRNRLLVLAYHGVPNAAHFEAQLVELLRHRRPLAPSQLLTHLATGAPLPRRSVLVTFDDGHRSVLEVAAPVLAKHAVPSLLFVVTSLIGTDQPFWWDEVDALVSAGARSELAGESELGLVRRLKASSDDRRRAVIEQLRSSAPVAAPRENQLGWAELAELESIGMTIGSHSSTHPCLSRCEADVALRELTESRMALEDGLSHSVEFLAYPNGDLARFRLLISGMHPAVHRLRGRS